MKEFSQKHIAFFLLSLSAIIASLLFGIQHQLLWYWILGLGFGYILEHYHMSFSAAVIDPITCRSTMQFRAILIGILSSSLIISVFKYLTADSYDFVGVCPVGIPLIVGAFLFGCGMAFAGCGASGMFVQLGEGHIIHILTFACIVIGFCIADTVHQTFWSPLISQSPSIFLPAKFGWGLGLVIHVGILCLFYILASNREQHPSSRINVSYIKGAVLLGVLSFLHMLMLKSPFSISEAFPWIENFFGTFTLESTGVTSNSELDINSELNIISAIGTNMRNLGLITGALISALFGMNFRWQKNVSKQQIPSVVIGGLLMGYGACIAGGCNITSFFVAASALSLSGWVFLISLSVGAFVGTKLLYQFTKMHR